MKFSIRISSVNVTDLVTFTDKILNGKLHFLCNDTRRQPNNFVVVGEINLVINIYISTWILNNFKLPW